MSEQELVLSVRHVTSGYRDRGLFRRGPYQEAVSYTHLTLPTSDLV